ncbi:MULTISPECIES: type II toxin-antitoxin system HicB family antitoxin [Bradyrhizobium]|uniref:type II toxin-antitoxin system HicB family antitoxin n=1 Tax=Bradyrhizobium elkanii TaxID=29448 RepID=UPI0004135639|nr:type II toxin-antitoxin system HicB family antitoxin [Bradyrhizobium elkanii]
MTPAEYLKRPYSRVVVPETDGTYRSEILEFPGCLATGDTAAQALANLEDVAASWLESVIAREQAVPEPLEENEYSGKLVLRLAKSIHQKAAVAARRDGVSLNTFIANCVAEHVGSRKATAVQQHVSNVSMQKMFFAVFDDLHLKTDAVVSWSKQTIAPTAQIVTPGLRPSNVQSVPWKQTNA